MDDLIVIFLVLIGPALVLFEHAKGGEDDA